VDEADPRLIAAAVQGDRDAFSSIVRVYQARVLRYLQRLLGDRTLAEDVAQEVFLRCYRALPRYGAEGKFSTWLFGIAHNAGVDAIRQRARVRRTTAALRPRRAQQPDPSVRVELAEALEQLPPKLRAALLVVEVLGLKYREAADVLGVPEGTVKSRVSHARERIVAWYADDAGANDALS
jgi:RNA polymerase sigma-70 factor, ECF subfamily